MDTKKKKVLQSHCAFAQYTALLTSQDASAATTKRRKIATVACCMLAWTREKRWSAVPTFDILSAGRRSFSTAMLIGLAQLELSSLLTNRKNSVKAAVGKFASSNNPTNYTKFELEKTIFL